MHYAVVHHIHVTTPHQYHVKLFVSDVPEDVHVKDIRAALTRSGYSFGEFGVPWANHSIMPESEWPGEMFGAWQRREAPIVAWDDIAPRAEDVKRVTIRIPAALHEQVAQAAAEQGVSINTFCINALIAAVQK